MDNDRTLLMPFRMQKVAKLIITRHLSIITILNNNNNNNNNDDHDDDADDVDDDDFLTFENAKLMHL